MSDVKVFGCRILDEEFLMLNFVCEILVMLCYGKSI